MEEKTAQGRADELARDVLTLARNTLLVNLRFLDAAASRFVPEPAETEMLSTDGQRLYYGAVNVLRSYRAEHAAPVRDYLHVVLHCVFCHMFRMDHERFELWDLACDIAVEHAIAGLGLLAATTAREQKQLVVTERIRREIGIVTAEKVYRYLLREPHWLKEFEDLPALFAADDHSRWKDAQPEDESFWRDISRRMQVDMETFGRRQGSKALAMVQNLREVNRESGDYAGFLRKFASKGETMRTDPEEFDYIFYTYGITRYGNMPLIEPVEYKPVKSVKDFVIAVDLCGLISAGQARGFLRKTFEVFCQNCRQEIRLHFLDCGGEQVWYHTVTTAEELESFLAPLRSHYREEGDLRPAFLWTEDMLHRQKFRNLKGLLALTDAPTRFAPNKPAYDAAVVFVNDNYSTPDVPPWAVRLVLQKDELDERT